MERMRGYIDEEQLRLALHSPSGPSTREWGPYHYQVYPHRCSITSSSTHHIVLGSPGDNASLPLDQREGYQQLLFFESPSISDACLDSLVRRFEQDSNWGVVVYVGDHHRFFIYLSSVRAELQIYLPCPLLLSFVDPSSSRTIQRLARSTPPTAVTLIVGTGV